jgi:hypothetical protein
MQRESCCFLCCSERKARKDELAEKLARLEASAGLVAQMKTFEKAQNWAVIEERMGKKETLKKYLEVKRVCQSPGPGRGLPGAVSE